jgi:hypothetical protein
MLGSIPGNVFAKENQVLATVSSDKENRLFATGFLLPEIVLIGLLLLVDL